MRYFIFNTNENNAPGQYLVWLENNLGFEHAYPDENKDINKLAPGDICLMYINEQGVKAIGEVLDYRDTTPHSEHMIQRSVRSDRDEYRIPVNWFLILPEPISHAELKKTYGILYPQGTVFHIKNAKDRAKELVSHLEDEHTRASGEIDASQFDQPLHEGNLRQVTVNAHERNLKARAMCIAHYGCKCAVCGFSFEATYGEAGKGIIEVHHITPLSQIKREYQVNPIKDLIPVCSNCHTIIHKGTDTLTIDEAKKLLR